MSIGIYDEIDKRLSDLSLSLKGFCLRDVVAERDDFVIPLGEIKLDFSKNLVTNEIMESLFMLARVADVEAWRDKMFRGEKINFSENRAVLHTALRYRGTEPLQIDTQDVRSDVQLVLEKMRKFSDKVRNGEFVGFTGKKIKQIVNIGIGGSDLGPRMMSEALKQYLHEDLKLFFVSNVDSKELFGVLNVIDWESTLFVVVSKTFTTQETMINARLAKQWLVNLAGNGESVKNHFVAVSTNLSAVEEFGIGSENVFGFWDWVGGRYSIWGAVGLSVVIGIGYERFVEFLEGGYEMDKHFRSAPMEKNMPIILALLGIWYRNYLNYPTFAVIPYDQYLIHLTRYLQQLDMESNGKSVNRNGQLVDYETGPIIWGEIGTNSQHSFFQLIHQGTSKIPVDFIQINHDNGDEYSHRVLIANVKAQAQALALGQTRNEAFDKLMARNCGTEYAQRQADFKIYLGNRPSNIIELEYLTPRNLGMLIALYEHKIFVQGIIWQINSFDQMGVELGKEMVSL